jgi:hypothetical protein
MQDLQENPSSSKAALFVDFDNIYLGLQTIDPAAAERFATDPARWLAWFEKGMPGVEDQASLGVRRSVLIRRCYLNPVARFQRFRRDFTHAGFSVIDCPPLTQHGKNSSDIHMVIDILDTLEHRTRFDEFIILSADSDFTPVLLKLRAYERRTAILTTGMAATAYKAACDRPINGDIFIKHALCLAAPKPTRAPSSPPVSPPNGHTGQVLDAVTQKVSAAAGAKGSLLAADLIPILREFPEFTSSGNWLGFGSLRNLAAELVRRSPKLRLSEADPVRLVADRPGPAAPGPEQRNMPPEQDPPDNNYQEQIMTQVRQVMAQARAPIPLTRLGSLVIGRLGQPVKETRWGGAGTLKNLLQKADLPDLKVIMASNTQGYLYDPARHAPPPPEPRPVTAAPDAALVSRSPETAPRQKPALGDDTLAAEVAPRQEPAPPGDALAALVQKVHEPLGIPPLTSAQYALVFQAIADELRQHPYDAAATPRLVQQRCLRQQVQILQIQLRAILDGIRQAGHEPGRNPLDDTAIELAKAFRNNVIMRCDQARLDLSDREDSLIDTWILGA